jgi:hypothetical protein
MHYLAIVKLLHKKYSTFFASYYVLVNASLYYVFGRWWVLSVSAAGRQRRGALRSKPRRLLQGPTAAVSVV